MTSPSYRLPPRLDTPDGAERRVGVEFEFAGLDVPSASRVVADTCAGTASVDASKPRLEHRVEVDGLGTFVVEIDWRFFTQQRHRELLDEWGIDTASSELLHDVERLVERIALQFVPCEIATPPIPVRRLGELDPLVAGLRDAGARGTTASLRFAFGLHLNPTAADTSAASILATLRAFLLLQDWIVVHDGVDLMRRASGFADPFPESYVRRVLAADYAPDLETFIDDYLDANPTRNRALDLLPLLGHLDEARVRGRAAEPELLKTRPTYHYRLPDCRIDVDGWTAAEAWNGWVDVERLAEDPDTLAHLAKRRRSERHDPTSWTHVIDSVFAEPR